MLVIVVVVILVSFYVFYQLHVDDASLSATLRYRYIPGTASSNPSVHIWGDVHNWGDSEGNGKLTIVITDDEGHRFSDTFRVGPVPPKGGVPVDKTYQWNYVYDPIEHPVAPVEVSFSI